MKGLTVQLVQKELRGYDEIGSPIYDEKIIDVKDVLVGQPASGEIINTYQLYGKKIAYTLGIPKGDTHDWTDTIVMFFGKKFRTVGFPEEGILENIPLRWGKNVKVETYE